MKELGITPFVYIETFNDPSMRLFESLGFKRVQESTWMGWKPS